VAYEELIENGKATQFKSGEQAASNGRIGGINSAESRRRKRTLKQAAELAMSLPVSDPKVKAKLNKMGFAPDDADNQMAVIVGLMGRAMKGDPRASALLFELLDDGHGSTSEQADSHNALIEAIRKRNNED
jgi:hypothetical protein